MKIESISQKSKIFKVSLNKNNESHFLIDPIVNRAFPILVILRRQQARQKVWFRKINLYFLIRCFLFTDFGVGRADRMNVARMYH
jgi:hypothetical protein